MAKSGVKIQLDIAKLQQLERECPGRANKIIQKIAQDVEGHIKSHWSATNPSLPGGTPAVDTGSLSNSVVAKPMGNGWVVEDGVEYGVYLEYGTENEDGSQRIAPRPWMLPAVEYVTQSIPPELLRGVVED